MTQAFTRDPAMAQVGVFMPGPPETLPPADPGPPVDPPPPPPPPPPIPPALILTGPSPATGLVGQAAGGGTVSNPAEIARSYLLESTLGGELSPMGGTIAAGATVPYTLTPIAAGLHSITLTNITDGLVTGSPQPFTATIPPPPPPPPPIVCIPPGTLSPTEGTFTVFYARNDAPNQQVIGGPLLKRQEFQGLFQSVETQGFESVAVGTAAGTLGLTLPMSNSPINATITMIGDGVVDDITIDGRFNTTPGGNRWWETAGDLRFQINEPCTGFGSYITDPGDFGADFELSILCSDGTVIIENIVDFIGVGGSSGQLVFFGFVVTGKLISFVRYRILNGDQEDFFGIDDIVIGRGLLPPCPPT